MLAVEVRLLTDRYVATQFNERSQPEWPPHPARLFSAMVATWADDDEPDEDTRSALAWFAALGAPSIVCSDAQPRVEVTHYVPVNDASVVRDVSRLYEEIRTGHLDVAAALQEAGGDLDDRVVRRAVKTCERVEAKAIADSWKAAQPGAAVRSIAILPELRGRQGRSYPCVLPESTTFWFVWPDAEPDDKHGPLLDDLLAGVSRLGHSSSMVACRLVEDPPPATLVPDADGVDASLRVSAEGLLDRLEVAFQQHQGREARALPSRTARYSRVVEEPVEPPRSVLAGDWFRLVRRNGPRLPSHRTLLIARAVRDALVSHADQPPDEIISGHQPGGLGDHTPPSTAPHLAVVPLPFVGGGHGDGTVMGVALQLPLTITADQRRAVLRAVGRWKEAGLELRLGQLGMWRLALADAAEPGHTIDRSTWDRPARRWVTATPIALDRHPGDLWGASRPRREKAIDEAVSAVRVACTRVGLPEPSDVQMSREGLLRGVESVRRFLPLATTTGPRRCLVHVSISFDGPVAGPLLLGAGRFLGYGLCVPRNDAGRSRE